MLEFQIDLAGQILRVACGERVGCELDANLLDSSPARARAGGASGVDPRGSMVVVRSGWDDARPHAAWTPQAWGRFLSAWRALTGVIDGARAPAHVPLLGWEVPTRAEVLVRPRAGDVLGDARRAAVFLRDEPGARLALEPGSLLAPEMEAMAEEHLRRMADAIDPARCGLLVLSGPRRVRDRTLDLFRAHARAGVAERFEPALG